MNIKLTTFLLAAVAIAFLSLTAAAHPATGIVMDRAGNIYFSDLETVWKIDRQGKVSVFRPGAGGRHVHELTIDAHDNIYGGDISYEGQKWVSDVWKMTPDGTTTYLLEPTTHPPRSMSNWLDRDGNMYLVDQNNHTRTKTLLLRRSPDGQVIILAGGAYGHQDGKGTAAKFSSVGGMAFGPDGSLYLTDGESVRRITMDGSVTTVARGLTTRTADDKPSLFGGSYGTLAGLSVDFSGLVYVADAGNRRLLRINREGKTEVYLRTDPPYFPNGVVAGPDESVYVLEFGFALPSAWSGPRVRKISADGSSKIIASPGSAGENNVKAEESVVAHNAGVATESFLSFLIVGDRIKFGAAILGVTLLSGIAILWKRKQQA